jgi:ribulose-phosphate 3-epimerase
MPAARVRIAPSILAADFGRLAEDIQAVEQAGADWIHVDVMDGSFVPNISVGLPIVRAVRRHCRLPVDVHLMIRDPERYVADFADAGADVITVHVEACPHLNRTLQRIHACGKRSGVALNPHTPEQMVAYVIGQVDLLLVMTVNPGFGGQSFLPEVLPKVEALRRQIDHSGRSIDLEVDGGIDSRTASRLVEAGADVLVAGTAIFGAGSYEHAIRTLRGGGS